VSEESKLTAVLLKLIGLTFGLGMALLVLSVVLRSAITRFMAIGLNLLGGVLAVVYLMLDDIIELREALQNNDLEKQVDMRNRAYDMLTLGGLMFLMAFVFTITPLIAKFGLTSYITVYTLLLMAIFIAMLLAHNIYIIKKASPGANKWWEETGKACALELLNNCIPKKDEGCQSDLVR